MIVADFRLRLVAGLQLAQAGNPDESGWEIGNS